MIVYAVWPPSARPVQTLTVAVTYCTELHVTTSLLHCYYIVITMLLLCYYIAYKWIETPSSVVGRVRTYTPDTALTSRPRQLVPPLITK